MSDLITAVRCPYYDGRQQASLSASAPIFQTVDPATSHLLNTLSVSTSADISAAIASARAAFPSWSRTPPVQRSRVLHRAVALLRARNDAIAAVETADTGRPISETSAVDVVTGADALEYYANLVGGGGLAGERMQLREDAWCVSSKEPLGVCAGIGAWNYPIQMYVFNAPFRRR